MILMRKQDIQHIVRRRYSGEHTGGSTSPDEAVLAPQQQPRYPAWGVGTGCRFPHNFVFQLVTWH